MLDLVGSVLAFIKNPRLADRRMTWRAFLYLYIFGFFGVVLLNTFFTQLDLWLRDIADISLNVPVPYNHKAPPRFIAQEIRTNPWLGLAGFTIVPLLEEAAFRLGLVIKPVTVSASLYFLCLLILRLVYTWTDPQLYLIPVLAAMVAYVLLKKRHASNKPAVANAWVVYGSCFLFGFMHNVHLYEGALILRETNPLMFSEKIFMGVVLAFARLQYGFFWCVALHAGVNAMPILAIMGAIYFWN